MTGQQPLRIVVVGASTGLGRCLAVGLGQRGDQVALLARRKELLDEAAAETGPGAIAIPCDVTDESSCREAVEEAARAMGGIDGVVYTTGTASLRRIEELDADDWRRTFETNVVGASTVTSAALPHLKESGGVVAYFSSNSASLTPPWPGLAAYLVTKTALDKLVDMWRAEHPEVGFTRVVVGPCGGGEGLAQSQFASNWDPELAGELFPLWQQRGCLSLDDGLVEVQELITVVETVLRLGASATIPSVAVTPRTPRKDSGQQGEQAT